MACQTHHACALQINTTGILIKGISGSGKTSLMLGLLERAKQNKIAAHIIADDQVILKSCDTILHASVPQTIKGLVEIRGYGIAKYPNKENTKLALVIQLVDDERVQRMPEQKSILLENVNLPLVEVPMRHESQAVRIVFAWLMQNTNLQLE